MNKKQENHHNYELCKKHMHAYVLVEINDGTQVDGIVTGVDDEFVYLALPIDCSSGSSQVSGATDRQFGGYGHGHGFGGGYGSPNYGYPGYGYQGYGGYPGQRFRRLVLPLTALAALSILPWY